MRRVATEIGAAPMALYRYVHDKGELHLLMADEAVHLDRGHWETMPESDWNLTLRRAATTPRRLVLAHPWWADVVTRGRVFAPSILRMQEMTLAGLEGLGLDIDEMLEITETVQTFAIGYAQREFHTTQAMAAYGAVDRVEATRDWHPYVLSLTNSGEFPYLRRIVRDDRAPHETDRYPQAPFERALDRIIAGIAATLPAL
jgi:AcrR family transcriptional regulator